MAPRGTIWGSICIVVTLSDIETIWTKFGQNPGFSLRNSVSLTPGPTVKGRSPCNDYDNIYFGNFPLILGLKMNCSYRYINNKMLLGLFIVNKFGGKYLKVLLGPNSLKF